MGNTKGREPAFPGQRGFVGGSMGDDAVIVEGIDNDEATASRCMQALNVPLPCVPTKKGHNMSKKPTMIAYTVKERGDGQKAIWKRIGAAWPRGSGTGFTLQLDTLPLDGRIVLTEPKDEDGGAP